MYPTRRREPVVAFARPSLIKRQPVPLASWLSKGGEFLKPSHHGRETATTATSLPVRFLMSPPSSEVSTAVLAVPPFEMSRLDGAANPFHREDGRKTRAWKPMSVSFQSRRPSSRKVPDPGDGPSTTRSLEVA